MKQIACIVLALTLTNSTAFAFEANRADVSAARVSSERLSAMERLRLKGRVVLARSIRADIRLKQWVMDRLTYDRSPTPATFVVSGAALGIEAILAGRLAGTLSRSAFGKLDKELSAQYRFQNEQEAQIRALRIQETTILAEGRVPAPNAGESAVGTVKEAVASIRTKIETHEGMVAEYGRVAKNLVTESKWPGRLGRWTRLTLVPGVIVVGVGHGLWGLYQLSINPEHVDEIERSLTEFIDDSRLILDAQ